MNASDWAAWYAAFVATVAVGWEVRKSRYEGVRLTISLAPNMQRAGGGQIVPEKFIFINVVNVGDRATELTHCFGYIFATRWDVLRKKRTHQFVVLQNNAGPDLPFRLDPGARWSGNVFQRRLMDDYGRDGYLHLGVIDAVSGKETRAQLKLSDLVPDQPGAAMHAPAPGQ